MEDSKNGRTALGTAEYPPVGLTEKDYTCKKRTRQLKAHCIIVERPGHDILVELGEKQVFKLKITSGGVICLLMLMILRAVGLPKAAAGGPAGRGEMVSGVAATALPSAVPTPSGEPVHGSPPLSLTLMLVFTGCSVGAVIAVLVVGAIASVRNRAAK